MEFKGATASQILRELVEKNKSKETISLKEINECLNGCGFSILMILFAFPMAIPLPYPPGFTTILGMPLLLFSIQMLMGMSRPWLPDWIAKRTMKISHLEFAVLKTEKYFMYLESKLKRRLSYFSSSTGEKIIGAIAFLCSISIILPIMFGNAVPSAGICIMALGLLGRDGLIIIIGMIVGIVGLFVSAAVVYLFFQGGIAAGDFLSDLYHYVMKLIT